jgi:hypothetical protein
MARLTGSILGNFRGRIGNLSARVRNGKTILAARPSSFNISEDPVLVEIRKRFRVTSRLSSAINSIPDIRKIWNENSPADISPFNAIFKENFEFAESDRPTINNKIVPQGGFPFEVASLTVDAASVVIDLPALNAYKTFGADEKDLSAYIVLVSFDPVDPQYEYFNALSLSHNEVGYDSAAILNITINLTQSQQNETTLYNQSLLLMCLATKDSASNVVEYSSTYTQAD